MKGLNAHGSCAAQLSTCFKTPDHAALSLHADVRGPRLPVSVPDKPPKPAIKMRIQHVCSLDRRCRPGRHVTASNDEGYRSV